LFHAPTVNFVAQIDAYLNNTYMQFFSNGGGGDQNGPLGGTRSVASTVASPQLIQALIAGMTSATPATVLAAPVGAPAGQKGLTVAIAPPQAGIGIPQALSGASLPVAQEANDLDFIWATPTWPANL